jgi:hypothetical protein
MTLERVGLAAFIFLAIAACATLSPRSRIESELIKLGLGEGGAGCLAEKLSENLSRGELSEVANFLEDLNRAGRRGFDQMLRFDNPRIAAEIAGAGVTCALSR